MRRNFEVRTLFRGSELGDRYFSGNNLFEFFGGTISPSSVLIDCDLIDSDIDFRDASVGFL